MPILFVRFFHQILSLPFIRRLSSSTKFGAQVPIRRWPSSDPLICWFHTFGWSTQKEWIWMRSNWMEVEEGGKKWQSRKRRMELLECKKKPRISCHHQKQWGIYYDENIPKWILSQFCAINLFYSLGGRKNLWKNEKNAIKNVQKCVGAILNKNVQNEEKKQKFCSFENKMRIVLDNFKMDGFGLKEEWAIYFLAVLLIWAGASSKINWRNHRWRLVGSCNNCKIWVEN